MKIWNSYASEHSMNLVMIGRFKDARSAQDAKSLIDKLSQQVLEESSAVPQEPDIKRRRFSDAMLRLLEDSRLFSLGSAELEQFEYDVRVDVGGSEVKVTTDEVDVSAFLKLLLEKGARVEVYSAHDYPDEEQDQAHSTD